MLLDPMINDQVVFEKQPTYNGKVAPLFKNPKSYDNP